MSSDQKLMSMEPGGTRGMRIMGVQHKYCWLERIIAVTPAISGNYAVTDGVRSVEVDPEEALRIVKVLAPGDTTLDRY